MLLHIVNAWLEDILNDPSKEDLELGFEYDSVNNTLKTSPLWQSNLDKDLTRYDNNAQSLFDNFAGYNANDMKQIRSATLGLRKKTRPLR